jgi:hypothetical protein
MEGLRILVSGLIAGLIFICLSDHFGMIWLLGFTFAASVIVELALSAKVVLPRAEIEQTTLAKVAHGDT